MYKLIAIDIDGTLLNDNKKISEENISAINYAKSKGVKIILCTGRPQIGMESFLEKLSLNKENDYCITSNGAIIQNCYNKKIISRFCLNKNDLEKIYKFTLSENTFIHFFDEKNIYTLNKNISRWTIHDTYNCKSSLIYTDINNIDNNLYIDKITIADNFDLINNLLPKLINYCKDEYKIFRNTPNFIEIINKNTDKGKAVEYLSNFLNISREETIAIGDNENDISMINFAGLGIAMDNSIDILKKYSKYITFSNNESGVAKAIKKFI